MLLKAEREGKESNWGENTQSGLDPTPSTFYCGCSYAPGPRYYFDWIRHSASVLNLANSAHRSCTASHCHLVANCDLFQRQRDPVLPLSASRNTVWKARQNSVMYLVVSEEVSFNNNRYCYTCTVYSHCSTDMGASPTTLYHSWTRIGPIHGLDWIAWSGKNGPMSKCSLNGP